MKHYDVIVLGTGGVGSAALYHLAQRGARAIGLDRFPAGHDRGSSHGATRIIRQAYYEHPDYVPLARRAYELWSRLADDCNETLYRQTGLLQVGLPDGEVVRGVSASARQHGLHVDELTAPEIERRWPGFRVPDAMVGVFEPGAGYLRVEACVLAHLAEAQRLGAELHTPCTVVAWRVEGGSVIVETEQGNLAAGALVIAAGPWAASLLKGVDANFEVRRKPVFWFADWRRVYDVEQGCPCFLFEMPDGIYYGMPRIDEAGIKVAEHTGGEPVADPLHIDREIHAGDQQRVAAFLAGCLPEVGREMTRHCVCLYTMTPDAHFIVDRHPAHPRVAFAAGLSGHGFKFTNVLGQALAELSLDGRTALPIGFLRHHRGKSSTGGLAAR